MMLEYIILKILIIWFTQSYNGKKDVKIDLLKFEVSFLINFFYD